MQAMASIVSLPSFMMNFDTKIRFRVKIQALGRDGSTVLSSDSITVNENSSSNGAVVGEKERSEVMVNEGSGKLRSRVDRKFVKREISKELPMLWDDGYGTNTVKDYFDCAKEMIKSDGGPPCWFCPVECGQPLNGSPVLLFLPGIDGTGLGLILHHKAFGKVFEVRCLHIPVNDRTSFQGLVKLVEQTVRLEHSASPNKPIYLVGDSFGGCLALAVAACNPNIDLVLILVNPATSFDRSQLQPILPVLKALPSELHSAVPYLLSFIMGDPTKMAMVDIERKHPLSVQIQKLSGNLTRLLPYLFALSDIIPKETLLWKLDLLQTAAAYANSRLHAVKAEVLVLSSGKDNMLPSEYEAKRLSKSLQNCTIRLFKDNGHTLLFEDGINLLTIIKGTNKYRHSRKVDYVADYLPPSMSEFKKGFFEVTGLMRFATGSCFLSTLEDGKIVKGLKGVPSEGPVILVGYHMLLGFELSSLVEAFIREKNILIRGLAHPFLFRSRTDSFDEFSTNDWIKVMGAVPVTPTNLYKLLSTNSHVLLYPGGAREALHYKGEAYKLIWPEQQEFVRMAAKFGATIVPFGAVGEDDIVELILDYNDWMKIPVLNDMIRDSTRDIIRVRDKSDGEVGNEELFFPGLLPKVPGRFYYLFGKPIETKGKEEMLKNKENATQLYLQIKSEVERNIAYLLRKREEDPYRSIVDRSVHRALYSPLDEVPAFDP